MASPQLRHGYTSIAHEILEALCRVNLSPYESRVMWFILRKTYGHHKKSDRIALSQIGEGTEIDRSNANRALTSLKMRNIVVADGDQLGFQKDHEKWIQVSRKRGCVSQDTVSPETTKRGLERLQNVVSGDHNKIYKIKDTKKATPSPVSDPRIKEFFAWWDSEYQPRFGSRYIFNGSKEGPLVKRALGTHDLPRVKDLALRFLNSKEKWIAETGGYTIGVFVSQINKLVSTGRHHASPQQELPA